MPRLLVVCLLPRRRVTQQGLLSGRRLVRSESRRRQHSKSTVVSGGPRLTAARSRGGSAPTDGEERGAVGAGRPLGVRGGLGERGEGEGRAVVAPRGARRLRTPLVRTPAACPPPRGILGSASVRGFGQMRGEGERQKREVFASQIEVGAPV